MLFLAIEARSRARAMMPLSLYASRNFSATNTLTLLLYFALGGALYYLPFGLIRLGGYSATQAGAALLPLALIMGFGAPFAGALSDRFGPRLSLTAGPLIAACGLALLAFADLGEIVLARSVSGDRRIWHRHDHHGSAADLDGDGVGGRSSRRHCLRRQQRRCARGQPACGRSPRRGFVRKLFVSSRRARTANAALNAVLAGQPDITAGAIAAFKRALRTVMLVTALCAALGGVAGWWLIRPLGPEATR